MGRWYGKIGYSVEEETSPGVFSKSIIEKTYFGETIRNLSRNLQNSGEINDSVNLANVISIIADPFANQNFSNIAYIEFMGSKWKVSTVEVCDHRLNLTIGGKYNG